MWPINATLCCCSVFLGLLACPTVYGGDVPSRVEVFRYASGAAKQKIPYNKEDRRHGDMEFYYPDGRIEKVIPFVNGEISGVMHEWYSSGIKMFEGEYQNKMPRGVHSAFTSAGTPSILTVYSHDGTKLFMSGFDVRGKVVYSAGYINGKPWAGTVLETISDSNLKAIRGHDATLTVAGTDVLLGYKDGVLVSAAKLPQVAGAAATEKADQLYKSLVVEVANDFAGASLDEVVEMVVMASGYQGRIEMETVAKKASITPVTIPASKMPFIQIVTYAANQIGCVVVLDGDVIHILDGRAEQ
jgi:hypothetical protein